MKGASNEKSVFEIVPQRRRCLYALHFTTQKLICQPVFCNFLNFLLQSAYALTLTNRRTKCYNFNR